MFSFISSIISVGGDGTFADCINGILKRAAKEAEVNLEDNTVRLPRAPTRLGIIPSGLYLESCHFYEEWGHLH